MVYWEGKNCVSTYAALVCYYTSSLNISIICLHYISHQEESALGQFYSSIMSMESKRSIIYFCYHTNKDMNK